MKRLLAAACMLAATIGAAAADDYPSRPITLIVPFGAGGPTDALARILTNRMAQTLGQPIVIENVTGGAGTIAIGCVARAAPDGYTAVIGNWASHVVNSAIYKTPFDYVNDFEPVVRLSGNPYIIVGKNALPPTLGELIAWLKANPDKATEGTGGAGSGQHVGGVYFQKVTGTRFQFVPYRAGSSDVMRDVVAGHIDLSIDQAISSLPYIRQGQLRGYAICDSKRLASAPEIPTVDEAGAPGVYVVAWYGMWMPKGTPKDVIAKFSAAAQEALADPAVRERLASLGQDIPPPELQTAEALGRHYKAEIEKWWPVIKAADIKVE
ncbi:MAG TPA: tripartite tricarboxylate transporter substrate-binding protein [Xanthobacteraceae bacterium]|nr:tripartite tricarboxylate transporter substrate-binding protein [Xanthobacteraceae bacterium]